MYNVLPCGRVEVVCDQGSLCMCAIKGAHPHELSTCALFLVNSNKRWRNSTQCSNTGQLDEAPTTL